MASTIKKDSRRLIAVGSGFDTIRSRTSQSIKLLSWGFRNTDTFEVSKKDKTIFEMKTWLGQKKIVNSVTKKDIYITLNKKDSRNFKVELHYDGPIKAPIKIGQQIGVLKIYNKKNLIENVPVYSNEEIKKINFFKSVFTSLNYMIWGDV